jgi:GPH family glycoside/pentoside/hexuronide:cation symporter
LGLQVLAFGFTLYRGRSEKHLIDERAIEQREAARDTPTIGYREQLAIVFRNRPFLYVIGIYLCSWLAVQLTASIIVYYVVSYMRLPEKDSGFVALAVQGTALVMLFFWQAVSRKLDKKNVYYLGMVFWIVAQCGLFLLQPGQVGWMYVLAILAGFGVSVAYLIPWSMIPDVIDLDELRTGQRREGIFYAFMVLLQKIGLALGLFLVGIALEAAGFKPAIAGEAIPRQPESALMAIRLAIAPLPAVFLVLGLVLAYFYPITRDAHREILRQLDDRARDRAAKEEGLDL